MSEVAPAPKAAPRAAPLRKRFQRSQAGRLLRRPGAVAGGSVVAGMLLVALFAPWVAPHSPTEIFANQTLRPPSFRFPFGTDELGRDVFSRVVYGTRVSVRVSLIAVGIGSVFGTLIGLLAGFFAGHVDNAAMRLTDVMLAFPEIILAIAIVAVLGPSLNNTMIAIGIAVIPAYARTVRASTMSVVKTDYIDAARAIGVGRLRVMFRHVLPNVISPIIVLSTLNIAAAVLISAGLSYIGLGAQPPTPEWGSMLNSARAYMSTAWWMATFPGLAIFAVVMAFNLLGDALRDAFDPRSARDN